MKRLFIVLTLFGLVGQTPVQAAEVVLYTARLEQVIKPLFEEFTKETGIQVKVVSDNAGPLMARMKAQGDKSQADVFMAVDAGNLWHAANQGLLKPAHSKVLDENIPAHLRDPEGLWYGFSVRARTLVFNTKKVKPSELSTYEDLSTPKWKGRLCLRTSKEVYNQSLVAIMIAQQGEPKTEEVVRGWVNNLATKPFGDDVRVVQAVAAGQCDVGIVNSYYYGRVKKRDPNLQAAIFWPDQAGNGVHVNVSGAGIARYAKHEAEALRFLEFMSGDKAQRMFGDLNMEYPANPKIRPNPFVASWGEFKQTQTNLSKAGEFQAAAVKLMDRVGYK